MVYVSSLVKSFAKRLTATSMLLKRDLIVDTENITIECEEQEAVVS